VTTLAAEATAERLAGGRPSPARALLAAGVVAFAAGAIVYKLLRSAGEVEEET